MARYHPESGTQAQGCGFAGIRISERPKEPGSCDTKICAVRVPGSAGSTSGSSPGGGLARSRTDPMAVRNPTGSENFPESVSCRRDFNLEVRRYGKVRFPGEKVNNDTEN